MLHIYMRDVLGMVIQLNFFSQTNNSSLVSKFMCVSNSDPCMSMIAVTHIPLLKMSRLLAFTNSKIVRIKAMTHKKISLFFKTSLIKCCDQPRLHETTRCSSETCYHLTVTTSMRSKSRVSISVSKPTTIYNVIFATWRWVSWKKLANCTCHASSWVDSAF